ncbi:MAG: hypothetical protein U9Q92_04630 [archaeon]|nr:hypothetical protein [archaeon]
MDVKKLLDELDSVSGEVTYGLGPLTSKFRFQLGKKGINYFPKTSGEEYDEEGMDGVIKNRALLFDITHQVPENLSCTCLIIYGEKGKRYYIADGSITSVEPVTKELTRKLREEYGLSYVPFDKFKIGMDMKSEQSEQ